jgi:alanyl-tRNA synthetase
MGDAYHELREDQARIAQVLLAEEEQFAKTLDHGMGILDEALAELSGNEIPGEVVFKLYDTYGFPVDLTNDIARERELTLDLDGYEAAMAEQRRRSQESGSFAVDYNDVLELDGETEFKGYDALTGSARVTALLKDGAQHESLQAGDEGVVILDCTPFYGESGGQVGDCGYLLASGVRFEVRDTTKGSGHHLHHGVLVEGAIAVGDELQTEVNADVRTATALNHSATHLLHAALRQVLGDHVAQKGSLVDSQKLRFDFSNPEAVSHEQVKTIEQIVNRQIRGNTAVETRVTDMDSAVAAGAMALFGEKYGDEVRVLSMGEDAFSVELCGGTHVARTGDIGLMRIVSESGISSGVRRIEAVTGDAALALFDAADERLRDVCDVVKANAATVVDKVASLRGENRDLEKQIGQLKQKLASSAGGDLSAQALEVNGIKVLATSLDGADPKSLRDTVDQLKNKLGSAVILLAAADGDKIALTAGVTKDLTDRVRAGDLMKEFATRLGGKGGGRPDMAQGGGSDVQGLAAVLQAVPEWVQGQLQ